ncbi:hypothetical protein [uncultured Methylobacterium sp.]|uniref:hypothetical protein n=1 Tax=uncultured Methylobacterium sp. TaxID=157278 RepID=UPI0035CA815B
MLHYDKLDLTRCHCRARLTRPTCEPVEEGALVVDRWLLGRVGHGPVAEDGLLAGLPLAEALTLCERLGAHALHPTATYAEAWRRDEAASIVREGFGIASGGPPVP